MPSSRTSPFLRRLASASPLIPFQCNVCGFPTVARRWKFDRETGNCLRCGSCVRHRALIAALSERLFGKVLPIPLFPRMPRLRGVGLSDWPGYGVKLARRLAYENTFFHQEPRLDICQVPEDRAESADFLISSDVFEHVPPPAQTAFLGSHRILRSGGLLVFTVPYETEGTTQEHFPDLFDFSIAEKAGSRILVNQTRDGRTQVFENLRFHGGPGATLEMRVFSRSSILDHLAQAGFVDCVIHSRPIARHGIWHGTEKSLPITARKP